MKMTQEELNAKLEAHAKWLKTRFADLVDGERANLAGADLTRTDLTEADLTGANLTHANLTEADLTGANLTYANLTDANLRGADITYADLTGANLTGANLNVRKASPLVYDALTASFAAQMALKKTRIEWNDARDAKVKEAQQ